MRYIGFIDALDALDALALVHFAVHQKWLMHCFDALWTVKDEQSDRNILRAYQEA